MLYLPPYSAEFNPIENAFSKLKALLRKAAESTVQRLWTAIVQLLDDFTPTQCANFLGQRRILPDEISFGPDSVLAPAMLLFWRHGYEATSLADLTGAMGSNPPSVYTAFGDKKGLFRAAVKRYLSRSQTPFEVIAEASSAEEAARAMMEGSVLAFTGVDTPSGMAEMGAAALGHGGEQDQFLLLHVRGQFAEDSLQQIRESPRGRRVVAVHRLDALGQPDEFRQFPSVDTMVTDDDRLDQRLRVELRRRRDRRRAEPFEIGDDDVEVDRLGGGSFGEGPPATAAVVELGRAKQRGRARQRDGDIAERALRKRGGDRRDFVQAHLKISFWARFPAAGLRGAAPHLATPRKRVRV